MSSISELILKKIFAKKKKESSARIPDEDFVPYVCHYDQNTILTKNGELLQIIRVTGFSNSSTVSEMISLRDAVRDSLKKNVKDINYALWFNTLRRKKNISPRGEFKDFFAKSLNEKWEEKNNLKSEYVNELYITIIIEGLDTSISNASSLFHSFSKITIKSLHEKNLAESQKKLNSLAKKILIDLKDYGAKLLGLKEWNGVLYSEPMRFFGKLINLYEERYPLVANDISNDLVSHKVAFGNREIEVIGYDNKNFAVIFSLKEYFEVGTSALDRILQMPFEFIITQSFDFFYNEKDLEAFEYQDYILKVSGDEEFRQLSGIANFVESNTGSITDYGKLQTTFMMISRHKEDLLKDVKMVIEEFSRLGFVLVHEDLFMEHCFWSQLPGNFSFLRRQKVINTYRVAGFASLHSFPSGSIAGNYWGSAVCAFKTVLNTPFFFNFHEEDVGHTMVVGPKASGKTLLINFLIAQSQKFNPKVFIFDFNNSSQCFVEISGGKYFDISVNDSQHKNYLSLNPLKLAQNSVSKDFLEQFFRSLVIFRKNAPASQELDLIPDIIDRIFAANCPDFISAVQAFNASETQGIFNNLEIWSEGKLNKIFTCQQDFDMSNSINGFDLTEYQEHKPVLIPLFLYLLHRIETSLDGSPAIIVLNQAFDLVGNVIFQSQISDFLERMRKKNCVVIFAFEDKQALDFIDLTKNIKEYLATEIFLPNNSPNEIYKSIFKFAKDEIEILKMMEHGERHFLLKHAEESLIATLNFNDLFSYSKLLACDQDSITVMQTIVNDLADEKEKPPTASESLPIILQAIQAIENERLSEEKAKSIESGAKERRLLREKLELNEVD
jgi:type IV secretion system protein VirB4